MSQTLSRVLVALEMLGFLGVAVFLLGIYLLSSMTGVKYTLSEIAYLGASALSFCSVAFLALTYIRSQKNSFVLQPSVLWILVVASASIFSFMSISEGLTDILPAMLVPLLHLVVVGLIGRSANNKPQE